MSNRPQELRIDSWHALIEMWKSEIDTLGDWAVYACLATPVDVGGLIGTSPSGRGSSCRVQEDVPVTRVEAPVDEIRLVATGMLADNPVGAAPLTFRELVADIEQILELHPEYDLVLSDTVTLDDESEATLCLPIGGIGMAGSSEDEYLQLEIVPREETGLVN